MSIYRKISDIRELLDTIEHNMRRIDAGSNAWASGEDETAMADCDPGIQFDLSQEIESCWEEIKVICDA